MSDDVQPDAAEDTSAEDQPDVENGDPIEDADTFPRTYVEKLRRENAGHREKTKDAEAKADAIARRLHEALVAQTARLQDPTDLPFAAEHLDDPEALTAAIDALLEDKPHLRARKVAGDVGQGSRGDAAEFSLLDAIKRL